MRIGHHAAIIGMRQQEKKLAVIANNLANVGTAGFKKENAHFSDYVYQTSYMSMEQGRVKTTGQPLDVALLGDGFFKVQTDDGILYTRGGDFSINAQSILVTKEGWPVLGQGGPVTVAGGDVRIEQGGQVFDRGPGQQEFEMVDTLDIAEFPKDTLMEKARNGYLRPRGEVQPGPPENTAVHQGALEDSNFIVVEEMVKLIGTQRIFEAYTKALQTMGEGDSQLINKLGST